MASGFIRKNRDGSLTAKGLDRIQAGMIWVNYKPLSLPEAPFGGVKDSGIGRELGWEGLDAYLETKAVRKFVGKAD